MIAEYPALAQQLGSQMMFDEIEFRRAMGHFATGVTIVTGLAAGAPAGLVVNSFTSVSLDPPLVLFCVADGSTTWPGLREAGFFCVNVLAHVHKALAQHFFSKTSDCFELASWRSAPSGSPVLDDALMWLDCRLDEIYHVGDHMIVIGRVLSFGVDPAADAPPLLFYRGNYNILQVSM